MSTKCIAFILFLVSKIMFSQSKLNYFYSDTVFEYSDVKVDIKDAMAYKDHFKTNIIFTNLSDSFKIIEPNDIKIYKGNNGIESNIRYSIVIPPKGSKKVRIVLKDLNFKYDKIKAEFSKITTTGKIESIYNPKAFSIDATTLFKIENKEFPSSSVGPLFLSVKALKYLPEGIIRVKLNVSYTGKRFLGMYIKKVKINTPDGKTESNINQQASSLYYRKDKNSMNFTLEFKNPNGGTTPLNNAIIILEDVFVEYNTKEDNTPFNFYLVKKGEGKGDETKEEKDIEVIED
jgi:hypothetical protein